MSLACESSEVHISMSHRKSELVLLIPFQYTFNNFNYCVYHDRRNYIYCKYCLVHTIMNSEWVNQNEICLILFYPGKSLIATTT